MIFNRFDAEAILKIPLSRRQVQDKMVWMHCRNGKYTVNQGIMLFECQLETPMEEKRAQNRGQITGSGIGFGNFVFLAK